MVGREKGTQNKPKASLHTSLSIAVKDREEMYTGCGCEALRFSRGGTLGKAEGEQRGWGLGEIQGKIRAPF